jgi:hypothetical protein
MGNPSASMCGRIGGLPAVVGSAWDIGARWTSAARAWLMNWAAHQTRPIARTHVAAESRPGRTDPGMTAPQSLCSRVSAVAGAQVASRRKARHGSSRTVFHESRGQARGTQRTDPGQNASPASAIPAAGTAIGWLGTLSTAPPDMPFAPPGRTSRLPPGRRDGDFGGIRHGAHRGRRDRDWHQGWADTGTAGLGLLPLPAPAQSGTIPGSRSPGQPSSRGVIRSKPTRR